MEAKISAVVKENAFRTSLFVTITETVKMAKMKTDVYQVFCAQIIFRKLREFGDIYISSAE